MEKYRKKPIVIEAEQFRGVPHMPPGICMCDDHARVGGTNHAHVHTLEGPLNASVGDWIIRGIKGEFYPCKPDIFAATYEPADTPSELTAERDALNQRVERLVAVGDKMASHPGHDIVGGTCMKCCAYDHAAVAAEWRVAREAGNGEGT